MNSKIIAGVVIVGILLIGTLTGYIIHRIQRQNLISEAQSFFDRGQYQETIDKLSSSIQGELIAADERVLTANTLYRLRQYDRALEILDPILRTGSEDARAIALAGWIWIKQNSPLQAQVRFEKAANMGLEAEAEGGMGAVAILRSENYRSTFLNEAESHLKKSIALDPNNPTVYLTFSELKRLQQKYDESIDMVNKAIQLAPFWSEPHAMLGWIYLLKGDHVQAEKAFTESQKYGGSKEETQYYLALSVYYQGRLSESLALLDELIKTGKEKVRQALIDSAKIALVIDENKSIDFLQRAWTMKPDPLIGMQIYELFSRQGKKEEASTFLNEVIEKWPFLSLAHLEMGNLLLRQNDLDKSYSAFQNVLEQDGRNYWANYNLGYISPSRGNYQQTPDYFEAVVREYEDYFPAQINLILGQLAVNRESDAEIQISELLTRYPNNPYLFLTRALERYAAGDYGTALDNLQKSLDVSHTQSSPYTIRGEIYLRLFQFEQALSSFDEALKLDEKNIRAQLGKAHATYRLGDFSKAEQIYQDLFTNQSVLTPDQQAEVQNGLALVALDHGETQKSMEIWNTLKKSDREITRQFCSINEGLVEESNPSPLVFEDLKVVLMSRYALPEAYYNMAVFHDTLTQTPEAIEAYETLTKRYPGYLPGLYNLANLYRLQNRNGDAIAMFGRAQKAAPQRVDILNNQAAVYADMLQYEKAYLLLDQAESFDNSLNEIRYNKILIALSENRLEDAKKILSSLKSSNVPSALIEIADGLVKMTEGNWSEAEKALSSARKMQPNNAYTCVNHGIALAKLKRYPEAQTAMQDAIRNDASLAVAHRSLGLLYCELGLFYLAEAELQQTIQLDSSQTDLHAILEQIRSWMSAINSSNP